MKATFSILVNDDTIRLTGEVIKSNAKTVVAKATMPEDFGGKEIVIKRHRVKHAVVIEE